jgi:hypothetical protein
MEMSRVEDPLEQLSRCTALEELALGWNEGVSGPRLVNIKGWWPRLRSLSIEGYGMVSGLAEVASLKQLTYLRLGELQPDSAEAVTCLGVLPELRGLVLKNSWKDRFAEEVDWAGVLPWVQQQPQLTSLTVTGGGKVEQSGTMQLPSVLEELFLSTDLPVEQLGMMVKPLAQLRSLTILNIDQLTQLPPWLSRLEKLGLTRCPIGSGGEVLAQLPLLRRVRPLRLLQHVPHLCWPEAGGRTWGSAVALSKWGCCEDW